MKFSTSINTTHGPRIPIQSNSNYTYFQEAGQILAEYLRPMILQNIWFIDENRFRPTTEFKFAPSETRLHFDESIHRLQLLQLLCHQKASKKSIRIFRSIEVVKFFNIRSFCDCANFTPFCRLSKRGNTMQISLNRACKKAPLISRLCAYSHARVELCIA